MVKHTAASWEHITDKKAIARAIELSVTKALEKVKKLDDMYFFDPPKACGLKYWAEGDNESDRDRKQLIIDLFGVSCSDNYEAMMDLKNAVAACTRLVELMSQE